MPDLTPKYFSAPDRLPPALRLQNYIERMWPARCLRTFHSWLKTWAIRSRLFSVSGRFLYHRDGKSHPIVFDGRNHQFHAIYDYRYRQGYEPETTRLMARLLRGETAPVFDIGANWGYFSLYAAAAPGFTGAIYAFEPNPRVYADLVSVIRQAELADRVQALAQGLGAEDGQLIIEETDAFQTGLARLVPTGTGTRVPVKCLDRSGLADPFFIKIDAEGMESAIIAGAREMIARAHPHIVFESFLDLDAPANTQLPFDQLAALGYRCFMPVIVFNRGGRPLFTAYYDDANKLLQDQPDAPSGLVEITAQTRFLTRWHINVFASHESRIDGLWAKGLLNINASAVAQAR